MQLTFSVQSDWSAIAECHRPLGTGVNVASHLPGVLGWGHFWGRRHIRLGIHGERSSVRQFVFI
jgi:hypothetical protein